jgi:hypothetical protein
MDRDSRAWAIGIFAVLLAGIPIYYRTVGRRSS